MHKRIYHFLQASGIFYKSQYGFRPKHSTVHATTEFVTDVIESLEQNKTTLSVFLDLSKAFDTIDHKILLEKLEYYGIRGTALKWFDSYLSNRKQYVRFNDTNSSIRTVTCGVPQGSVLGPLLFIIYTNDLSNCLKHAHAIVFADDTTIYESSYDQNELYNKLNYDL